MQGHVPLFEISSIPEHKRSRIRGESAWRRVVNSNAVASVRTGILLADVSVASAEKRTVGITAIRIPQGRKEASVTSSFPTELVVLTTVRHFEPAR